MSLGKGVLLHPSPEASILRSIGNGRNPRTKGAGAVGFANRSAEYLYFGPYSFCFFFRLCDIF